MAKPNRTIQSGKVKMACWPSQNPKYDTVSYSLQKSYKDKDGKYQNTGFFNTSELMDIINVCQTVLREKVKVFDNSDNTSQSEPDDMP